MAALAVSQALSAQTFLHPGLLHSEAALDRISAQLEAGDNASVMAGWKRFNENVLITKNRDGWIDAITGDQLIRGGAGQNFAHCERDFGMCYVKALYWRLKRNSSKASERSLAQTRAEEAVYLLNRYAKKIRGISGDTNYALLCGFQGWQVAGAAELLRDFEGWSDYDQQTFRQWLYDVWYTQCCYFLQTQHGQCDAHYMSNWPAANITSMQAIGIYLDDPFIYNYAMQHIKRGTTNASLSTDLCGRAPEGVEFKGFLPYFWDVATYNAEHGTRYQAPLGFLNQNQENTRDQGHSQVALGAQLQTCEQAWTQGDDLYGIGNQMLAGGVEYTAGWVSADETDTDFLTQYPNGPWWTDCGKSETRQPSISYDSRTNRTPVYQMAINHYGRRMGLDMPYARQAKALCGVEGGTGFAPYYYSDVIGFGDLLFNEDSLTARPTRLRGELTMVSGSALATVLTETTRTTLSGLVDGQHQTFPELSNIADGSVVRLEPVIADGSADTGHWRWDDDTSIYTRTREVTVHHSMVLRARYVNAEGVESVQMFSLHREGDGFRPRFQPYAVINKVSSQDTLVTVQRGGAATLGVEFTAGRNIRDISWERQLTAGGVWSAVSTGTSRTDTHAELALTNILSAASYRVTVVTLAGVRLTATFRVSVSELDATVSTVADGAMSVTRLGVEQGSTVTITATASTVLAKAVSMKRVFQWRAGDIVLREDTLTFHEEAGTQVADITDALTLNIDTATLVTLDFHRISAAGVKSDHTVLNFQIMPYRLNPLATDYYYLVNAATDQYLAWSDATFADFDESAKEDFQWRLRQLANRDNRYLINNRLSTRHLDENGAVTQTTNYNLHLFDLLHLAGTDRFAIRTTPTAGARCLVPAGNALAQAEVAHVEDFPFRIIDINSIIDGIEDIEVPQLSTLNSQLSTVTFYDLSGRRVPDHARGILIRRTTYADGTIAVDKIMR